MAGYSDDGNSEFMKAGSASTESGKSVHSSTG